MYWCHPISWLSTKGKGNKCMCKNVTHPLHSNPWPVLQRLDQRPPSASPPSWNPLANWECHVWLLPWQSETARSIWAWSMNEAAHKSLVPLTAWPGTLHQTPSPCTRGNACTACCLATTWIGRLVYCFSGRGTSLGHWHSHQEWQVVTRFTHSTKREHYKYHKADRKTKARHEPGAPMVEYLALLHSTQVLGGKTLWLPFVALL